MSFFPNILHQLSGITGGYPGFHKFLEFDSPIGLGLGFIIATVIAVVIFVGFTAVYALTAVYVERKVSAFMQDRLGPMEVGYKGTGQTAADILKLLQKEDIIPAAADKWLFTLGPIIIFTAVFAGYAALPFSTDFIGSSINIGLFYILGIVAIDVIGLLMAGWGSNNKYALFGSIRSVAQIISYEIPASLAILSAVMICQTLDLQQICYQQGIWYNEYWTSSGDYREQSNYLFGLKGLGINVTHIGGIITWNIFRFPLLLLAYIIYFIASLAECNRAPFDIPEAESELVAGFHVEYTGFKFAVIFLAEYAMMFIVGLIAAIVFLGGWNTPLPNLSFSQVITPEHASQLSNWELLKSFQFGYLTSGAPGTWAGNLWGCFWILSKAVGAIFIHIWIRWTLPRLRVDQLMYLCWKVLVPAAFLCVLGAGIWRLWMV